MEQSYSRPIKTGLTALYGPTHSIFVTTEEFYIRKTRRYTAMGISNLVYDSWMKEAQYKKYEDLLPMLEKTSLDKKILDIGMGSALFEEYLKGIGKEVDVVGIDPDKEMIKKAEKKGFPVQRGVATELPFEENSFNLIVCLDTIHKAKDEEKAMQEMKRVLKPGGHVIVTHFCNAFTKKKVLKKLKKLSKDFEVIEKKMIGRRDSEVSVAYLMKSEEE